MRPPNATDDVADAEHEALTSHGLKHWRTFGVAEWRHVGDGVLGFVLGSALPLALFYGFYKQVNLTAAIIAVLMWSGVVFAWHRRRTGGADVFSAMTFASAVVEA